MGFRFLRSCAALTAMVVLTAFACQPVSPDEAWDQWEFEGFPVISFVPENPVGLVYFFHGSGGSAAFVTLVETTDTINELTSRGYGFVSTESTLRTGTKRWAVTDPSLSTNPDLARLERLQAAMIATTDVTPDTAILGVGMSNGARMVTLFGQSFADAGYPVVAIAPYAGRVADPVTSAGGLTVPSFFVINVNDQTVDNAAITTNYEATVANGTPALLTTKYEEPLLDLRFTRIPGIDEAEAELIRQTFEDTGVWDPAGVRVVDIEPAIDLLVDVDLPRSVRSDRGAIRSQVQALLGLHQFTSLHRVPLADFFDEQLS
jgi:hypothetical protein